MLSWEIRLLLMLQHIYVNELVFWVNKRPESRVLLTTRADQSDISHTRDTEATLKKTKTGNL